MRTEMTELANVKADAVTESILQHGDDGPLVFGGYDETDGRTIIATIDGSSDTDDTRVIDEWRRYEARDDRFLRAQTCRRGRRGRTVRWK